MNRIITAALLLAVSASVAAAARTIETKFLAVQLTSGTADLASMSPLPGNPSNPPIQSPAYHNPEYWF